MIENKNPDGVMSVQWHITSRCGKRCRHCYMFESERYKEEIEHEISYENICLILDSIEQFEKNIILELGIFI